MTVAVCLMLSTHARAVENAIDAVQSVDGFLDESIDLLRVGHIECRGVMVCAIAELKSFI